jgi:hypothetical protein
VERAGICDLPCLGAGVDAGVTALPCAVRVWASRDPASLTRSERRRLETRLRREAERENRAGGRDRKVRPHRLPSVYLIIHCGRTRDEAQRLPVGSCQIYEDGRLRLEILIYPDDLLDRDPGGFAALNEYVLDNFSDALSDLGVCRKPIVLMSLTRFLDEVFYSLAYQGHAAVIGLGLASQLSRMARAAGATQEGDGFSLTLWDNPTLPRLQLRIRDNKRTDIRFGKRRAYSGESGEAPTFRGHFLDLRTLAYGLTGTGYSLNSACVKFKTAHQPVADLETGGLTVEGIESCRQNCRATWDLAQELLDQYERHQIALLPTQVRSGASMRKATQRAARIPPVLARDPSFDRVSLGQAMVAYYGGRCECLIRLWPVPVVYVDFIAMYTTVAELIGVWPCLIAESLSVEDATDAVRAGLEEASLDWAFKRETWQQLLTFVELEPDGEDRLPSRALYTPHGAYQIAVNYLESSRPLWYTYADAIASKLLTGKVPRVRRAWRLVPHGARSGLAPVQLGEGTLVDPTKQSPDTAAIETRYRLSDTHSPLGTYLKLASNSAYGLTVEMNPERLGAGEEAEVEVFGTDTFRTRVGRPEKPGEFCFPPLGSAITGAGRLMLALLECLVREAGGTYAFCDTDSMAIVATELGGLIACPGGPERLPDGKPAIRALSWAKVEEIRQRFSALNPYARDAVPGSILKIEDVNFGEDGEQRQLYTFAIAPKRYVLFVLDANGEPVIVDAKAHGLGHLLAPDVGWFDSSAEEDESKLKPWMRELWLMLVRRTLDLPAAEPDWLDEPAFSRVTVSQPGQLKLFADYNRELPYADQIKPASILIVPHVSRFGHPVDADRERFVLFAIPTTGHKQWSRLQCIERHSRKRYAISTSIAIGTEDSAGVETYRNVLTDYVRHPEVKFNGPDGNPCRWDTVGLLSRRHIRLDSLHFVGKESNELEAREYGLVQSREQVQTEYVNSVKRRAEGKAERYERSLGLVDAMGEAGAAKELGVSERTIRRWLRRA